MLHINWKYIMSKFIPFFYKTKWWIEIMYGNFFLVLNVFLCLAAKLSHLHQIFSVVDRTVTAWTSANYDSWKLINIWMTTQYYLLEIIAYLVWCIACNYARGAREVRQRYLCKITRIPRVILKNMLSFIYWCSFFSLILF